MNDSYDIERAKKLVTIGKTIRLISLLVEVLIIVLYHLEIFTSQKAMLLSLALVPWIRHIFALIYPEVASWDEDEHWKTDESKKLWEETHIRIWERWHMLVQVLVMLYLLLTLKIEAQTSKGFKTIAIITVAAFIIMVLIGCIRIKGESKVSQVFYYGMTMLAVIGVTVVTVCYCLSGPEIHEECTYVSGSYEGGHRNHPIPEYYVTVRLKDGTKFKCNVTPRLYDNIRNKNLVVCRRKGPLGIEYLHVHEL